MQILPPAGLTLLRLGLSQPKCMYPMRTSHGIGIRIPNCSAEMHLWLGHIPRSRPSLKLPSIASTSCFTSSQTCSLDVFVCSVSCFTCSRACFLDAFDCLRSLGAVCFLLGCDCPLPNVIGEEKEKWWERKKSFVGGLAFAQKCLLLL